MNRVDLLNHLLILIHMQNRKVIWFILILLLAVPASVQALATFSGGQVAITSPVNDDVFASGGMVDINAPVASLIVAGGTVNVNAPVRGDVIAAGGTVNVNTDIGGKLVAAGGTIDVKGNIGTNAILTGGAVNILPSSTIARDAMISGGQVSNAGHVIGNLSVNARTFENTGTAGHVDVHLENERPGLSAVFGLLGLLFIIGMFVLGIVLLKVAPEKFLTVESEVRKSPVIRTIVGFVGLIVTVILLVILGITVVLLPIALVAGMVFLIAVLLSTLFVASSLGRVIAGRLKWSGPEWQLFLLGFVILNILFLIPVIGVIILVISVSLGFGAFLYAIREHRQCISGAAPEEAKLV
jgi:hypothetical protein